MSGGVGFIFENVTDGIIAQEKCLMLCFYFISAGVIGDSLSVCLSEHTALEATVHKCESKSDDDSVDVCVIEWVCEPLSEPFKTVCVLNLHKQMHISKPPHYWQQENCTGQRDNLCVHLCVCLRVSVCSVRLIQARIPPRDLVNQVGSPDRIATECAVAPASVFV